MLKKIAITFFLVLIINITSFCFGQNTTVTAQAPATITTTTTTQTVVTPGTAATRALTTPDAVLDRAAQVAREVGVDPALVAQILTEQQAPAPAPSPAPQGPGTTPPPAAKKAGFPWWLVAVGLAAAAAIAGGALLARRRGAGGGTIYPALVLLVLFMFLAGTAMAQTATTPPATQTPAPDDDAKVRKAVRLNTESISVLNGRLQKEEKKPSGMGRQAAISRFVELPKYRPDGWAAGMEKKFASMEAEIKSLKDLVQGLQVADTSMEQKISDVRDSVPTVGELTTAVVSGVATASTNLVTRSELDSQLDAKADATEVVKLQGQVDTLAEEINTKADKAKVENMADNLAADFAQEIDNLRAEFGSDLVWILDTMSTETTQVGTTGRRIPVVGGVWNFVRGGQAVKTTPAQKEMASDIATRLADVRSRYFGENATSSN